MLLRLHVAHAFVSKRFDSPYLWKQSRDYLVTRVQTRKWLQTRTLKRPARRHKVTKTRRKISSGLMVRQSYCCYTTRSNSTLHECYIHLPCLHEFKRSSFTQVFALVSVFSATCVYSRFHASSCKQKVCPHMKVFAFIVKTDTCKRSLDVSQQPTNTHCFFFFIPVAFMMTMSDF